MAQVQILPTLPQSRPTLLRITNIINPLPATTYVLYYRSHIATQPVFKSIKKL